MNSDFTPYPKLRSMAYFRSLAVGSCLLLLMVAFETSVSGGQRYFRMLNAIVTTVLESNSVQFPDLHGSLLTTSAAHPTEQQFVSSDGNDSNDGLTSERSKKTIYAALIALKGGTPTPPTAGHGIVWVSD